MDPELDFHTNARALLSSLTETGKAVRLAGLTGGLADVRSLWVRHVGEMEDRLFPCLVAGEPAADGPVGFCLAEHAALSARLRELEAAPPTREWIREAELLIGRLIQHLFLEGRLLRPLLDRMGPGSSADSADDHPLRRALS